jgi:hypothetical protein
MLEFRNDTRSVRESQFDLRAHWEYFGGEFQTLVVAHCPIIVGKRREPTESRRKPVTEANWPHLCPAICAQMNAAEEMNL